MRLCILPGNVDLLNFVGVMPFELKNFPKYTTEAACQGNSSETTEKNFMKLKTLKHNLICYLNRFFTFDYSLWDGGRHIFLWAKTNFNCLCLFSEQSN
jgi:hypothetical protein